MHTPIPVSPRAYLRRLSEEIAIVVQEAFHGESELKAPASVSLEAEAATAAAAGLEADLVLVHPSGTSGTLAAGLDELIQSLRRIGLQPIAAKGTGSRLLLMITAPLEVLEREAERLEMDMLLLDEAKSETDHQRGQPAYRGFTRRRREQFALKQGRRFSSLERQRLIFSMVEATADRGGAELNLDELVRKGVLTAYLPLHDAKERRSLHRGFALQSIRIWPWRGGVLSTRRRLFPDLGLCQMPLHRVRDYYGEKIAFYFGWLDHYTGWLWLLMWGSLALEGIYLFDGCDFLGSAALSPPEPALCPGDEDRTSFLAETCTTKSAFTLPLSSVVIALWATLRGTMWARRQHTLAFQWDVLNFERDEAPRPRFVQAFHRMKSITKQRGFYMAGGGTSRVRRFVPHPAGEEMLVLSPWRRLCVFFCVGAPVLLLVAATTVAVMLSIFSFSALLRLGTQFEGNTYLNSQWGPFIGAALNTVWISVMNVLYKRLAACLNGLEHHRTDTEYEDALIRKSFLFQCINSYGPPSLSRTRAPLEVVSIDSKALSIAGPLVYVAFAKPNSLTLFGGWGYTDPYGDPYTDTCGARGRDWWASMNASSRCSERADSGGEGFIFVRDDCWSELRVTMLCFMILKPLYELPLQVFLPRLVRWLNLWRRARALEKLQWTKLAESAPAKVTREARPLPPPSLVTSNKGTPRVTVLAGGQAEESSVTRHASQEMEFRYSIERQISMRPFDGTFSEYNTKVVQFGYIALFSACFPLASFCAMLANFVELRVDAHKLGFEVRRPRYLGAKDAGSWQQMMALLSWLAIVVNVLLLATSWTFRDYIVTPIVADRDDAACEVAPPNEPEAMTPFGVWSGTNISWDDDRCRSNYRLCFAEVGSVPWLPASEYLDALAYRSQPYADLLCDPADPHHDARLCSLCGERRYTVWYTMVVLLVALEHAVLLTKVLFAWLVPRRPQWVAHAEARAAFLAQRARDKAHDARQSAVQLPEEPGDMPREEQAPLRRAAATKERHDAMTNDAAIHAAKGKLGDIEAAVNARLAEADCTPELPRDVELVEQHRRAPDPTPRKK